MTTIIAGLQNSVLVLESSKSGWKTYESMKGSYPQSIAFDHLNPSRAYCGTFGDGLWKTDNSGRTWDNIGKNGISIASITSVSVSPLKVGMMDSVRYTLEPNLVHYMHQVTEVNHGKE